MMHVTDRRQAGQLRRRGAGDRLRRRAAGQPVPAVFRRAGPRHGARRLRCRDAFVRHRARCTGTACPSTGSARRCAGSTGIQLRAVPPRSAACLSPRDPKTVDGKLFKQVLPFEGVYDYSYDAVMRSVDDSLQRLGMHRIDVLLIHDVDVWTHGSEAARLERFREVMEGGYHAMLKLRERGRRPRHRRRDQRDPGLRGLCPRRRFRLFPAGWPLHPAGAGSAGHAAAVLRREGHLAADRRPLQYRDPRHRRRRRRLLQLRSGPGRDPGPRRPDRGRLCPPCGAAGQCRPAVPARPPERGDADPGRPFARRDRPEPRHLRGRHPGRLVGRAQA